jgi:hypothetical protein
MKKTLLIFILLFSVQVNFAQQFGSIHFAQNYATFKYYDSEGNPNKHLTSDIKPSYGFNMNKFFKKGIFGRAEIGYKNYGAISMLDNNERINWSLNYLDFNLGGGYMYSEKKLKPYVGVCFYTSYLYKADQIIGSRYYNLLVTNSVKRLDYGINSFLGLQYPFLLQHVPFTEYVAVFAEYRNVLGLFQLETNNGGTNQRMYNRANSFHFGVSFFMKENAKARME